MPKKKITTGFAMVFFAVLLFAACKKQEKPAAEAGTVFSSFAEKVVSLKGKSRPITAYLC